VAGSLKAFQTPSIPAIEMLSILGHAAELLPALESGGLMVRFVNGGNCQLILPIAPVITAKVEDSSYKKALDAMIEAFNRGSAHFTKRTGARSISLVGTMPPTVAALEIAMRESSPESLSLDTLGDPANPVGSECLVVIDGPDLPTQIDRASAIVRRCPMARFGAMAESAYDDPYIVIFLDDDPQRGSALGGLIAREDVEPGHVLARYNSAACPVFLPRNLTVPKLILRELGVVLRPFADLTEDEVQVAFGAFSDRWGIAAFQTTIPVDDARTMLEDETLIEEVSWRFADLRESAEAAERMRAVFSELAPKPGYRLSLHEVHTRIKRNLSLEQIREAIAELEAHAALVQGLQAKQLRLLRFSTDQLPAMADFLLQVPVAEIDRGTVRYGYQASALEPQGTHFLLYDPDEVALHRPFPEWRWRARTTDTPIRYWVDPHWAEHYRGGANHVRSIVFTPYETVLHPTLHSFSSGDMDGYLRDLMVARFSGEEHNEPVGEMLKDRRRATGFVFNYSPDPEFEILVEVLDLDSFTPVRERLDWINDHLLLVDPSVVEPQRITQVAESLFEGQVAESLMDAVDVHARELDNLSQTVEAEFVQGIGSIMRRVESEIATMGKLSVEAISFLGDLSERVAVLANLMEQGQRNLLDATNAAGELDSVAEDMEAIRKTFKDSLSNEFKRIDAFIVAAETRSEQARGDLAELRSKLEAMRYFR